MKTKILLFTFVIFLTGSLAAQDYADTICLGHGQWGAGLNYPGKLTVLAPNDGDYANANGATFPFSQSFQFTPNPDDPATTDNVNVDITISVGANYFDEDTWEIVEDSVLYYNNVGGRGIGVSTDPDPKDESSPAWIDNSDRRQFNNDEVLTVAWTTINNTPANELYPKTQTSILGITAYTIANRGTDRYPLVYLNGEHVGYVQMNKDIGDGTNLQFWRIITDLITEDTTKIVLSQNDTLQIFGRERTYWRMYSMVLVMEDTEPATALNLSAEGGAAEITEINGSVNILGEILPVTSSQEWIRWSLENNDINATINTGGVVQAYPRESGNGNVTVKGTVGDVSSTIEVTISGQFDVPVDSIYVNYWNDTISENGGTLNHWAEVYPDIAANQEVVWSVEDNGTGATIDSTGLLQAAANDNGNGTVIVRATAADGSGVFDTTEVVIINQENVFVESIEITYDGDFAEIVEDGGTLLLNANVLPELASDKTVNWSLEDNTIGATIDENGLLTASGADDGNGVVTVKAEANDGSGVSATISVTVAGQTSVSVPLTELQKAVRLYPNPVSGNQTMVLEISDNAAAIKAIHILDITGRKVAEMQEFSGNATRAELSFNNEKGIYLIKVDTDKGSIIRRAVVK